MRSPLDIPAAGGLGLRIGSAVVLVPVVLFAAWRGGLLYLALVAAMAGILVWEWLGLMRRVPGALPRRVLAVLTGAVVAATGLSAAVWPLLALPALLAAWVMRPRDVETALGFLAPLYVGGACVALVLLRRDFGAAATIWAFLLVWATDTGAYAFGRSIGGPRLAPRISPNKTWAGLFGGMACAALVGAGAIFTDAAAGLPVAALAAFGGATALVAQGGDLFESVLKRRVGVKDSGVLIPGHGGLFDRVDGLMTAAPMVLVSLWAVRWLEVAS